MLAGHRASTTQRYIEADVEAQRKVHHTFLASITSNAVGLLKSACTTNLE